jgi:DNA-directed RNA polymerase III subunit RPC2
LDDDGIAAPGENIRSDDIYINKQSPIDTMELISPNAVLPDRLVVLFLEKTLDTCLLTSRLLTLVFKSRVYRPSCQTYKGIEGESCVVDRVALFNDRNDNISIKFLIRHTRRPEVKVSNLDLLWML